MAKSFYTVFLAVLILSANVQTTSALLQELAGAALGVAAVTVGAPLALGALGFTAAGITAGSVGAGLMSTAATTGAGGAAVAALQSVGAAGVGLGLKTVGAVGGVVASTYTQCNSEKKRYHD